MEESTTIEVNPQLLTSFPNQNNKLIDYVIVYEKNDHENHEHYQRKEIQKAFFNKLKSQGFEIYELEHKHGEKNVIFALLNCSMDRLLEEAELSRLEMMLKNVNIEKV